MGFFLLNESFRKAIKQTNSTPKDKDKREITPYL